MYWFVLAFWLAGWNLVIILEVVSRYICKRKIRQGKLNTGADGKRLAVAVALLYDVQLDYNKRCARRGRSRIRDVLEVLGYKLKQNTRLRGE